MDRQPENPPTIRRENKIQIQGPRPSPLKINKESNKIKKKPPIAPKPPLPPPSLPVTGNQPIIIYSISPKPIVVDPSNFRSIVQHLTGKDSTPPETTVISGETPVSPAARFAAIERTSPKERERRDRRNDDNDDVFDMMMMIGGSSGERFDEMVDLEMSQIPGILSPAPANLPVISSGMFSPAAAAEIQLGFGYCGGGGGGGGNGMSEWLMSPFLSSPSSLFLSSFPPIVSPSPTFGELFNFDF